MATNTPSIPLINLNAIIQTADNNQTDAVASVVPLTQQASAQSDTNVSAAVSAITTTQEPTPATQTSTTVSNNAASSHTASTISNGWKAWWKETVNLSNGLGTTALLVAIIFGIGAWVGMKIQISQGSQNMELTIWTVCTDHEAIQNTSLCRTILAKDFSQFGKRLEAFQTDKYKGDLVSVEGETSLAKREVDEGTSLAEEPKATQPLSPFGKALAKLSPYDRGLVAPTPDYSDYRSIPEPGIRIMVFPLVNLLVKPLSWIFDFIESMLLLTIYCIHKIFKWLQVALIFCLQAWMYSFIESLFKSFLAVFDQAIYSLMPSFLPAILVSDIASVLLLTALRAYWYSSSYLGSLKWVVVGRFAIWVAITAVQSIPWAIKMMQGRRPNTSASIDSAQAWLRNVGGADASSSFPTSMSTNIDPSVWSSAPKTDANMQTSSLVNRHALNSTRQAKPTVLAPPPRGHGTPSLQSEEPRQRDRLEWASSNGDREETAEESFYKTLNVIGRRRHASVRN